MHEQPSGETTNAIAAHRAHATTAGTEGPRRLSHSALTATFVWCASSFAATNRTTDHVESRAHYDPAPAVRAAGAAW